jgi:uncharacterized protein
MSAKRKGQAKTGVKRPRGMLTEWVRLDRSPIHGQGIYAAKDISSGTRVIEYVGERITKAESDRRDAARQARMEKGEDGCVYIFQLNKRYDLDGGYAWNPARLINHACNANCESQNIRGHIWVVARRDIAAGDELFFDYGFGMDNWRDHRCLCKTKGCIGYIVAKPDRWRVKRILAKERAKPKSRVVKQTR